MERKEPFQLGESSSERRIAMGVTEQSRKFLARVAEVAARTPAGLKRHQRSAADSGQALVETALVTPFLLLIALNVVNFGYFFLMAVNLAAAPRSGTLYSIIGDSTPASSSSTFPGLPPAGSSTAPTTSTCTSSSASANVEYLTNCDVTGALYNGISAGVQVCSSTVGLTNAGKTTQTANCNQYQGAPTYSDDSDLESPLFVLDRVDIVYTFTPLVPGTPFNILLLASPTCTTTGGVTCTFHRMSEMREMN